MVVKEIIFNGIRYWKILYQGIPGKKFIIAEQRLFNLYNL